MGLETILLAAAVGSTTASTAMQVRGAQQQADARVATAKFEAQVFKAEERATRRLGAEEAKILRENLRSTLKRQVTLVAKSGTTMRGSPMQIALRTVEDNARDIGTLLHARDIEAKKFGTRAQLSLVEAKFARKAGKLQVRQALFGGASRLASIGFAVYAGGLLGSSPSPVPANDTLALALT